MTANHTPTNYATLFPDNRKEGETPLRQAQLIMLRMLKVVDHICRKHNIRYWLCSGTLLGAVRHQGFIPWDDDLDISMMREDYERFLEVAPREFPEDIFLQTHETDPAYIYWPLPCKIRDEKSIIKMKGHELLGEHKGFFLDVFVLDKYPKEPRAYRWQRFLKEYFFTLCYGYNSRIQDPMNLKRRVLSWFFPVFRWLVRDYQRRVQKIIRRNKQIGTDCYVGFALDVVFKRVFDYQDIFPLKELAFEDSIFYVPNNYHHYLVTCFGESYMTPPPEDKRGTTHLQFIEKIG